MSRNFPLLFISIFVVFVSCAFEKTFFVATKQSLKSDTTFDDEMEGSARNKIERNRAAEERINLSFPGTKW